MAKFRERINDLLTSTDVEINGSRDWDIQVHDDRFYKRVLADGSLGLGESYMEKWWDVAAIDQLFYKLLITDIEHKVKSNKYIWAALQSKLFNLQSIRRAFHVGEQHYDTGNDLFTCMLDKRRTYTCGYWKNATNLDQAQEDKLDLVCRKIGLQENQRVLDIGCGWGSFIKFAAERYGAQAVGVTVSKEQAEFVRKDCAGLVVDVRLQDYRELNEKFDHIISLGMFEHVGPKNHKTYMQVASRCLKDEGLFLLHTIGSNYTRHNP
ncbi:MAG: cyclopropane fatty acyl phospholipid synthase, partial [Gammaproteobacteria bacterium]|nr:cyclopropane fatty acyl phospholipid synthase [Gammaproteobacteria bacterium]